MSLSSPRELTQMAKQESLSQVLVGTILSTLEN